MFQYKIEITGAGTTVGDLRFTTPQSDSEVSDANYIHFGDSDGFTSAPQNSPAFDQVVGGDFTASFAGTNIMGTNVLLVRLDLEHVIPTGTPPEAASGDIFTISLVQDADTFFLDNGFEDVTIGSSSSGTVNFSAVPEPNSLLLLSVGLLFTARRRRTLVL